MKKNIFYIQILLYITITSLIVSEISNLHLLGEEKLFAINYLKEVIVVLITGIVPISIFLLKKRSLKRSNKKLSEDKEKTSSKDSSKGRYFSDEARTFKKDHIFNKEKSISKENKILMEYLSVLNIKDTVFTIKELKVAYKKEAKIWHPDFGREKVEKDIRNKKMIKINEAYNFLKSYAS